MAYLMIVDDDEDFAAAAAKTLRNAGHEVRIELETASAIQKMEERPPDLLILDVMFPQNESAGFELARTVRQEGGKLRNVPILMLTAVNTKFPLGFGPSDVDEHWLPINDFVEKPVDLEVLRKRVSALLAPSAP
jgi:DNA-binding response OmpR family regulator